MVFQVECQVPGVVGSDCGGHEGLWGLGEATIILCHDLGTGNVEF